MIDYNQLEGKVLSTASKESERENNAYSEVKAPNNAKREDFIGRG